MINGSHVRVCTDDLFVRKAEITFRERDARNRAVFLETRSRFFDMMCTCLD